MDKLDPTADDAAATVSALEDMLRACAAKSGAEPAAAPAEGLLRASFAPPRHEIEKATPAPPAGPL